MAFNPLMQFLTLAVAFQEILKNFLWNCKALNVFYCTLSLSIRLTIRDEHGPDPEPNWSRILTFLAGSDQSRTGI